MDLLEHIAIVPDGKKMRGFDWDKPILGRLTATDFAEAAVGVAAAAILLPLLLLFAGV